MKGNRSDLFHIEVIMSCFSRMFRWRCCR